MSRERIRSSRVCELLVRRGGEKGRYVSLWQEGRREVGSSFVKIKTILRGEESELLHEGVGYKWKLTLKK